MPNFPIPQEANVLPQVGAVLHLDTERNYPGDSWRGNKHWKLDGSCALLDHDRALTIRHTLGKPGRHALFFPYTGFSKPLDAEDIDFEPRYTYGDFIRVVRLEDPLKTTAPFPYAYRSRSRITEARVSGFGRWRGWKSLGQHWGEDGIQRTMRVGLRGTSNHDDHRSKLDIGWWSGDNQGLIAGSNNSGGPVLFEDGNDTIFLGLTREHAKDGLQSASRIGTDRCKWLTKLGIPEMKHHAAHDSRMLPAELLLIDRTANPGKLFSFPVPSGSSKVQATLSATPGIRLQMAIEPGTTVDLEDLSKSDESSGRFLFRDLELDGAAQVTLGIAPVAHAPATAAEVQAQLCVMFV